MDSRYEKLYELLKDQKYPKLYMYKFIIKQDKSKLVDIKKCFDETAEYKTQESKNGNFISVTIKQMMLSADDIIAKYELVGKIENVITL